MTETMENWMEELEKELTKSLPGTKAQTRMASSLRRPMVDAQPARNGSVLILIYPRDGNLHTVFIKRTEYEGVHSGQVSFPGGMSETGDASPADTALREAVEETGISYTEVKIIGKLTSLHIPVSNVNVFPFVAVTDNRPSFVPNPVEVQYLIEARIEDLANPLNLKTKIMDIMGNEVEVPYYDIHENHIWGATAMILSEFMEVVEKSNLMFEV
jgi:8-oxo-dGTP pyrophosphatase MutT (NUDIX family)